MSAPVAASPKSPEAPSQAGSAGAHRYFFLGNCQMHYLCSMVGAVSDAPRYLLGAPFNVNVTLEGAPIPYVRQREFLAAAREVTAAGGRAILLLQDTPLKRYDTRVAGWGQVFTDIVRVPPLNFRALWPTRVLHKEIENISPSTVRRVLDWELHDFRTRLRSAGVTNLDFAGQFFRKNLEALRFYHPGHPNGEVFADFFDAMSPEDAAKLPCYDQLKESLRRSWGVYQTSSHPILPKTIEVFDLPWARTPLYSAWSALKHGPDDPAELRKAVDRATALLGDEESLQALPPPMRSHFRGGVGMANLKLGRTRRALHLLQEATIELKGFRILLRATLRSAIAAGRLDVAETLLTQIGSFLTASQANQAGIDHYLERIAAKPGGGGVLSNIERNLDPTCWLHAHLQTRAVAQEA